MTSTFLIKILLWSILFKNGKGDELSKHFEAHRQSDWQYVLTMSASGEWYTEQGDIEVSYYFKGANKRAVVAKDNSTIRVMNAESGWEKAEWTNQEPQKLDEIDLMAFEQIWYFGSPLWGVRDRITRQPDVKIDEYLCSWYRLQEGELTYDYFIRQKDDLLYSISISNAEGFAIVNRKVLQYRDFGGFVLPSQVLIVTSASRNQYIFTDFVIGDVVKESWFSISEDIKKP